MDQEGQREFYEAGTRIELMMNRHDKNYERLNSAMYAFLGAESTREKYQQNPEYLSVCQDILKEEWEILKRDVKDAAKP